MTDYSNDPGLRRMYEFLDKLKAFLDEHAGEYVAPDHGIVINYTPLQTGDPEWPKLWLQSCEVVHHEGGGTDLMEQGPYDYSLDPPEPCELVELELP